MTQDEQNEIDLRRVAAKRITAFDLLEDFKQWQCMDATRTGNQILLLGLYRDITRGTEDELDSLIERMTEINDASLMKKLGQGIEQS